MCKFLGRIFPVASPSAAEQRFLRKTNSASLPRSNFMKPSAIFQDFHVRLLSPRYSSQPMSVALRNRTASRICGFPQISRTRYFEGLGCARCETSTHTRSRLRARSSPSSPQVRPAVGSPVSHRCEPLSPLCGGRAMRPLCEPLRFCQQAKDSSSGPSCSGASAMSPPGASSNKKCSFTSQAKRANSFMNILDDFVDEEHLARTSRSFPRSANAGVLTCAFGMDLNAVTTSASPQGVRRGATVSRQLAVRYRAVVSRSEHGAAAISRLASAACASGLRRATRILPEHPPVAGVSSRRGVSAAQLTSIARAAMVEECRTVKSARICEVFLALWRCC